MNKQGAFTDIFIFMIVAVIILLISGIFIYLGATVKDELQTQLTGLEVGENVDYNATIENTIGDLNSAYNLLYWISIFIIVGMVIAIFMGSYMVTTRPIFFIPYIFIGIIAILVSVGISNAYQEIITNPELASTFAGFIGSNFIMVYLPAWVTLITFTGGIIMFARMKSQEFVPQGF